MHPKDQAPYVPTLLGITRVLTMTVSSPTKSRGYEETYPYYEPTDALLLSSNTGGQQPLPPIGIAYATGVVYQ